MKNYRSIIVIVVLFLSVFTPAQHLLGQDAPRNTPKVRFGDAIESFMRDDSLNPPPKGAILFVGSSIFRQWTSLKTHMSPLPVFNRAFGGSRTSEVLYYMDKIVLPYAPRIIVYYCGSNDVNAGEPAQNIFMRFREFTERVGSELPHTLIFFVSINRAPQKMKKWEVVDSANALVKDYCLRRKNLGYIDVNPVLFDREGKPRLDLYKDDKLHFKEPAYEEFTSVIKPVIEKAWKEIH
jgi:lysophospholipase L1-like esterase